MELQTVFVYKYLKKEHLKQFKEKGTVSIGNIYWFRDIENAKIRDPFEGRTKYVINAEQEPVELSVEQVNAITNDYHISAALRIAPNSHFADFLNVPNAFVFSTSYRLSEELMRKFGCNGYYKIIDIKQFADTMSEESNKQCRLLFTVTNKVIYVKSKEIKITNENKDSVIRTTPYDKSKSDRVKTIYIEDYFIKPEEFRQEEEFRFIFIPANPISKEPVYISCKKLVDYCELAD